MLPWIISNRRSTNKMKIRARVTIGGDTEEVIAVEEAQKYFDDSYFAELDGVHIGDIKTLKSELELREDCGGGFEGKEKEITLVTFFPRGSGG